MAAGTGTLKALALQVLREVPRRRESSPECPNLENPVGRAQERSAVLPPAVSASSFPARDPYAVRMRRVWECLCQPEYPAGMIPWLADFSPALYGKLTSRLPDRIQRLWQSRAPIVAFEAACRELVECHRSAVVLFRWHGPKGDWRQS
jgi:hypothetical protein